MLYEVITDSQNSREKYSVGVSYQALWPIFDVQLTMGDQVQKLQKQGTDRYGTYQLNLDTKQQFTKLETSVRVPFNLSNNTYSRLIQPQFGVAYEQSSDMTYSQTYASYPNQPINLTLDGLRNNFV